MTRAELFPDRRHAAIYSAITARQFPTIIELGGTDWYLQVLNERQFWIDDMSFRQSHIHQFHIFSLNVNGPGGISPPGRLSEPSGLPGTSGFPDLCFRRTLSHLCIDAVNGSDQLPLLKISQSREAMIESCT